MVMINNICVNVRAVKKRPVKFDQEHQSKRHDTKVRRRVKHFIKQCRGMVYVDDKTTQHLK